MVWPLMAWGLEVLANDPIPANRKWVPIVRRKYGRHRFETREDAETAITAMLRGNQALQLRAMKLDEE